MHSFANQINNLSTRHHRIGGLILAVLLFPGLAQAAGFTVRSVETRMQDEVYLVDTNLQLDFSEEAQKALQSGIPIIILLDIEVEKLRSWWWNKTVATLQQGYLLLYHALTEKYIVNNLNSGAQSDYTSLGATLSAIEKVIGLPLIDSGLLDKEERYRLKLRVHLDIESLPAPMRPLAYVSSDWQLASDWYTWPLQR
ncbi:MAG: DUF4390 domain-containing protein [Gammaproteobacteria bacterium]|nr:DUF4390 domain-containing protein [Gammaproteobacteria bacterium]